MIEVRTYNRPVTSVIDEVDADLEQYVWSADNRGYLNRWMGGRTISLHREIAQRMIGRPLRPGEVVDHMDRNPLNNARTNLRVVDRAGDARNRGFRSTNRVSEGQYKCVYAVNWGTRTMWEVRTRIAGRGERFGPLDTEADAARLALLLKCLVEGHLDNVRTEAAELYLNPYDDGPVLRLCAALRRLLGDGSSR